MNYVEMVRSIASLSEQMAVDASLDLDAQVTHCPAWRVRDLVEHLGDVPWFWAEVVSNRFVDRESIDANPRPSERGESVAWLRTQTARLVSALEQCDEYTPLWTWWPPQQHGGFVVRRQMIEVAVHGWDASNAVGVSRPIDPSVAAIGLAEFVEVMTDDVKPGATPSAVALEPSDHEWRGVLFGELGLPTSTLRMTASDSLLALWGRTDVSDPHVAQTLAAIDLS